MASTDDTFRAKIGRPDPALPPGLVFQSGVVTARWERLYEHCGAGWFMDRFLLLFCEGIDNLQACLDAWSFLVPEHPDRMVLGRNAYGAILTLENANTPDTPEQVGVLDPTQVKYWTDRDIKLTNLITRWIPDQLIPNFFVTPTYNLWVKSNEEYLADDVILGAEVPFGLGGTWHPSNFNEERILAYYESTAPVYAKALGGS